MSDLITFLVPVVGVAFLLIFLALMTVIMFQDDGDEANASA